VILKVDKKGEAYAVSEVFKNPDFGSHTQPPVLHRGHFFTPTTPSTNGATDWSR
jgi:hypothetical protein